VTNETLALLLPGEPAPVRLMNTIWADTVGVHDDLTSPAALHDWLVTVDDRYAADAVGDPRPDELAEAKLLRDALRRLAAFVTVDARPAAQSPIESVDDAVAAVNRAATHLPRAQLVIRDGRFHRDRPAPASPTRVALAELAHDSIGMLTGPSATKLRACHAPRCLLYFVRSQPRREWCSETCGNRARAARHYRRIRAARHQS
jgi:predicted RNA-binding Zn ribbon-like protein